MQNVNIQLEEERAKVKKLELENEKEKTELSTIRRQSKIGNLMQKAVAELSV
jgi:hypothetical protein